MRHIILTIINSLRIPRLSLKFFRAPRILFYHGVTDRHSFAGIENYCAKHIPQEAFLQQVQFLRSRFQIVSLEELIKTWSYSRRQAEGMLAITFDDGYQNVFRVAWPILKKYNIPFTVFISTDFIEKQNPLWVDCLEYAISKSNNHKLELTINGKDFYFPLQNREEKILADIAIRNYAKSIPEAERQELIDKVVEKCGTDLNEHLLEEPDYAPLSWNELLQMVGSGLVNVGSHTASHAIATRLPKEKFHHEVLHSGRLIEKQLNVPCSFFAYPNGKPGDFSEETTSILQKNGFSMAFTTELRFLKKNDNPLILPRLGMDGSADQKVFLSTISGIRTFLRSLRDFILMGRLSSSSLSLTNKNKKGDTIDHFDRQAREYEHSYSTLTPRGYSFRIRRKKVIDLLKNLPLETKILDVGCGPGVYVKFLLDCGFNIWGVDPAPEMIQIARHRFKKSSKAKFMVGQVEALPFDDRFFDVVIAAGLFEYFNDLETGLREVHRVLGSKGTFVATFPYRWSLARLWDRLIIRPMAKVLGVFYPREAKIDSKEFSSKEVKQILEGVGFSVQKVVFYNARLIWTPFDRFFPRLSVWLSEITENLTPFFLKTGFIVKAVRH